MILDMYQFSFKRLCERHWLDWCSWKSADLQHQLIVNRRVVLFMGSELDSSEYSAIGLLNTRWVIIFLRRNTMNKTIELSGVDTFEKALCSGLNGAEETQDFDSSYRLSYLEQQYGMRSGKARALVPEDVFSAQFVMQQAAERYFLLLQGAVQSLDGVFSDAELSALLNSNCGPIWNCAPNASLAGLVADDRGIEDLDDLTDGCELKLLLQKLISLTTLQTVALTDLCERFWRNPSQGSVTEMFESMGLELAG
jgi:hypothetical protein